MQGVTLPLIKVSAVAPCISPWSCTHTCSMCSLAGKDDRDRIHTVLLESQQVP